jgi:hypothetical protein
MSLKFKQTEQPELLVNSLQHFSVDIQRNIHERLKDSWEKKGLPTKHNVYAVQRKKVSDIEPMVFCCSV